MDEAPGQSDAPRPEDPAEAHEADDASADRTPSPGATGGFVLSIEKRLNRVDDTEDGTDPWQHRRGEPRMFTLLWSIYILASAGVTVFAVRMIGPRDGSVFEPGARMLLALLGFGVGALWPMVRLSQSAPERPARASMADLVAVLAPMQAVVWPLALLTSAWSLSVLGGCMTALASWSALIAGLLAIGTRTQDGRLRTGWMSAALLVSLGAPALGLLAGGAGLDAPQWLWWCSPISVVWSLTSGPSGATVRMSEVEWIGAAAPLAPALALWAIALALPAPALPKAAKED